MTRGLEIGEKALEYSKRKFCPPDSALTNYDIFNAFTEGAQWADEHPKDNLVDIDKVCKWIKEHNGDYISIVPNDHLTNNFYDDLRKSMKGE